MITGDVSTTSMKREFHTARAFIEELKTRGMHVYALPGNHDCYTKMAQYNKSFYYNLDGAAPFQSDEKLPFHLEEDGVCAHKLRDGLWLVQIDTTHASAYFQATGVFKSGLEDRLEKLLARIPESEQIILANHFPFFQNGAKHTRLIGGDRLEKVLRSKPNIILYLHGHTHRQTLADMRPDDLPVVLDSGSLTEKESSTWNLITFDEKSAAIESIGREGGSWSCLRSLEIPCH